MERAGLLIELGAFIALGFLIDAVPGFLGLSIDPAQVDGWTLLAVSLVRVPLYLFLIAALAHLRGQRLADIGLAAPPQGWVRVAFIAVLAVIVLLPGTSFLFWLLQQLGLPFTTDVFEVETLFSRIGLMLAGIVAGGFGEELIFRGYLFLRLEALLRWPGHPRRGLILAAALSSILFALPHEYQGEGAVVEVFFVGLFFAWIVVLCRRNLWPVIAAHALYDVVLFSL